MGANKSTSCHTCGRTFQDTLAADNHKRSTGHCYCRHCSRAFKHQEAVTDHERDTHNLICCTCSKILPFKDRLQAHQRSTGHGYCSICDRYLASEQSLEQHRQSLHNYPCGQCTSVFKDAIRLSNHQRNMGHCYCQECSRSFEDPHAYSQHLRSTVHVSECRCLQCERDFISEQALEQHLKDKKNHHPPAQSVATREDGTHTCNECDRQFTDRNALKQHLESVVHRPLSSLKRIASSRCKCRFTSPSALLQHLESGSCRSGLDRASLNQLVQSQDAGNMITFGNMVGPLLDSTADDGTSTGSSSPGVLTPSSHSSDTYSGIMGARLGLSALSADYFTFKTAQRSVIESGKLSCPLCPGKSRDFRTTQALENHLASPAHAPKIFHCPVNLISSTKQGKQGKQGKSFIKEFSTLSGLTQHVESGACDGGKKMVEEVMTFVQEKLGELGFEKIKLLK